MFQTIGLLTLLSLVAIVCSFFFRHRSIGSKSIFFIFCIYLLAIESILFITAQYGINNHVIANVNTLIYYSLAVLVLFNVLESINGKGTLLKATAWGIIAVVLVGWIIENFIVASITVYNSVLSSIVSLYLVLMSVYLINVLLFKKNNNIIKDSDGLLLIGMLIRSFSCGLLLLFLNYRMNYSDGFYKNILFLFNIALIISNIFFFIAILCLPKNRRYTWPF